MMRTLPGVARVPIMVWGAEPDPAAMQQAEHLADLPFAFHHVALMPDTHVGYGMPIGGVLAAEGRVIPHAVGLDIGCGVRVWKTNVTVEEFMPRRDTILSDIMRSVPTGFEWHKASQESRTALFDDVPAVGVLLAEVDKAKKQVGTLGGGNHFIEVQRDTDGIVWAMVHSGSRNLGKQMATHYDQLARQRNASDHDPVPPNWGLAHLPAEEGLGAEYLRVMDFCLRFARESRRLMGERVQEAFARRVPDAPAPGDPVDVHHNYAAVEEHFGRLVVVHRKGAVRAEGTVAIPGSMGSHTWIGRGLCNADSFCSCAHGAGRRLGRGEAKRQLTVQHVIGEMRERDVRLFKAKKSDVAEEAPEAYKDIDEVMDAQRDLVEPTVLLTPLGVVKG
ncbi:MAG TPA: RtcB family protein [Coriobacteriia bacterium]|jgi:tRNA-splicing ligase RtcB